MTRPAPPVDVRLQPPSRGRLYREVRGVLEIPRLIAALPRLSEQPRGDGMPVLVLPGYGRTDRSTALLRRYLQWIGYRSLPWGLGRNGGDVPALLPRVCARLCEVADEFGDKVHLVGWSLGGYLAREAAREHPDRTARVITLGSPVVGGPKYTAVAPAYRRRGVDLDAVESWVEARYERPLEVAVTAVYSRSDPVVAWQACIDRRSPRIEPVEVDTTHFGLGVSPEVYRLIAERLASGDTGAKRRLRAEGGRAGATRALVVRVQEEGGDALGGAVDVGARGRVCAVGARVLRGRWEQRGRRLGRLDGCDGVGRVRR